MPDRGNTTCKGTTGDMHDALKERPEWRSTRDQEAGTVRNGLDREAEGRPQKACRATKDSVFIIRAMGSYWNVTQSL